MKAINVTKTGRISIGEFCAACLHRTQYLAEPFLYEAFRVLDVDCTGYIDVHNIMTVTGMSERDAERVVQEADLGEVGHITYCDFLRAMFGGGTVA